MKKKHIILGILVILYCVITYLTFTTDNLIGFIASYVTTNLLALIIGGFIGYCAAFIGNLPLNMYKMENEQKKSDNHNRIYIIIIVLVFCSVAYFTLRGYGNESGSDNNSTATVDRIKDSAGTAASNIADAARGNNNAEKAIQRADEELERSQAAAEDGTKRINRIEQLVEECIDGNREALSIMHRIETTNTAGKEKSQS